MRIVLFYHSLISDWNHGNAHFLRGIIHELQSRQHQVRVFEPLNGWSLQNLLMEQGPAAMNAFSRAFPSLRSNFYDPSTIDLDEALDGADLVIVHEWNDSELVGRIGKHRLKSRYSLFFHDTHHAGISDPDRISNYQLEHYDGVLAFGGVLRELYIRKGWANHAWTWHEAADTTLFRPLISHSNAGQVVWIGNWGDDERTAELSSFFIEPVRQLGLVANVYGVRYPDEALALLRSEGIRYMGWIPNFRVPEIFSQYRATVHIPRGPYVKSLPGIPTIRVYEALACGIPLVCSQWNDIENLFHPGEDFLMAHNSDEMKSLLRSVINDSDLATALAANGLKTIRARHTCAHRVDELLGIWNEVRGVNECALLFLDPA